MADSFTSLLSGGLLDTSAPNYARIAGSNEKKRQGLIRLGLQQINSVFSGGTAPFYSPALTEGARFDPSQTYYSFNKKGEFTPYWAPGGRAPKGTSSDTLLSGALKSGGGDLGAALAVKTLGIGGLFDKDVSPKQIAARSFRRGQLFKPPEEFTFEGFQEPFYEKRAQDYVNFALPQLAQQYQSNRNAMLFGLANRGLGGSTVQGQASSNLEREAGKGRQTIADTGLEQANQLRRDVESARQQAVNQLYQSADPAQALQGAVRAASSFRAPSTFAPITNLFTNLAQQYATNQLLNSYRQPYGAPSSYQGVGNFLAPIPSNE
jgi:hypothetical protein